jgi:ArsR family transcriptional regulator, arsenate/arsenite/antimonite-responsive transcriptional repressor
VLPEYIGKNRYICSVKSDIDLDRLEKISRALGDPYRVQILDAIRNEPDGLTCNTIVEIFNLAQSTVSHHLKQLVEADLLLLEKEGRFSRYFINRKTFGEYAKQLKGF